MRRADPALLTPREREEMLRRLAALVQVKDAVRLFDDGEIDLVSTVDEIAAAMSAWIDRS